MQKDRVLVTGSTGFIGSHLIPRLTDKGFDLVLPIRDIANAPLFLRNDPKITLVPSRVMEVEDLLDKALAGVFCVVHLAGLAHVKRSTAVDQFDKVNAQLTERLAKGVERNENISLFVNLSSLAAITGNSSSETVSDVTVPRPTTHYGRSKLKGEEAIAKLRNGGVCSISLRPPIIVGSRSKGNWRSLQRLAKSGIPLPFALVDNRRSMVSVETVIESILHLCLTSPSPQYSGNYCIADSEILSLADILRELRLGSGLNPRLWPLPVPVLVQFCQLIGATRLADSLFRDLVVDSSRFRSVFHFSSPYSISEAIRKSALTLSENDLLQEKCIKE